MSNRKRNERDNRRIVENVLRENGVHRWNIRRASTGHIVFGFTTPKGEPKLLTVSASGDPFIRHVLRQQVQRMVTP